MNFFQKLVKHPFFWPLIVVIFAATLASRTLLFEKGYFNMHDDLQMMRQLEMEKCFLDGQIPCRWVPDMGYGYGFPLFNFYPPLPYLIGEIFRVLQFSFINTVKLTFALSFFASGITMYFLAKEFFGKWGGVISSVFYIWAPYHSVDVYVRGAMNESWAFIWYPAIFLFSYKLIYEKQNVYKWFLGLSLSWAGLLLSHNLMVMIFTPVFAFWCLLFWLQKRDIKKGVVLVLAGILALCLSAFFTLPAVLEQKFIHVDSLTQGYYMYISHYATIGQLLISRYWGYGPSIWGPNDGFSLQLGQIHWLLSIIIVLLMGYLLLRRKLNLNLNAIKVLLFSFCFAWFAAFMTHQNSTFIWQKIPFLAFTQFPWRFLTLATFGFSLLSGGIILLIKNSFLNKITAIFLLTVVVIINLPYFLPLTGRMGPLSDTEKFNGIAWNMQRTAGILDYLPKTAKLNPRDPQNTLATVAEGKGSVVNSFQGTNWAKFDLNLSSDSVVRINLFQFPQWNIKVDNKKVESYIPQNEDYGRMYLNIPKGQHSVVLNLTDTPIRKLSNIVSFLSWAAILCFIIYRFRRYA
jgi:hypothetical protein